MNLNRLCLYFNYGTTKCRTKEEQQLVGLDTSGYRNLSIMVVFYAKRQSGKY